MLFVQGCSITGLGGGSMNKKTYKLSDFTAVQPGMTYDEVVAILGEPTGSTGSGIVWITYNLADGRYMKFLYGSENQLTIMRIVDSAGRYFDLEERWREPSE